MRPDSKYKPLGIIAAERFISQMPLLSPNQQKRRSEALKDAYYQ